MKNLLTLTACVVFLISSASCLKTRAQLKDDNDVETGPSQPIPAQIQEVPQGKYAIDEIKSAITQMTGRIEDLERKDQQNSTSKNTVTREDFKKLEARMIELEQAQAAMLESLKKTQASMPTPDRPDLFEKAKASHQSGDFEEAVGAFTDYLKTPNGKHVEEATFLRAESFYALKQYKKAIADYSRFPEKFHRSKRLPQALLKIGYSFEALGMKDDARAFYQELVEKFPKTPEAKKIRSKLK